MTAKERPAGRKQAKQARDLKAWQAQMGYTYDTAAKALGVSRSACADWIAGRSRTTAKPIDLPPMLPLACAAIAAGLEPWSRSGATV